MSEPRTGTWRALVADLQAELDQGHMTVCRIVERHRPEIQRAERVIGVAAALERARAAVAALAYEFEDDRPRRLLVDRGDVLALIDAAIDREAAR